MTVQQSYADFTKAHPVVAISLFGVNVAFEAAVGIIKVGRRVGTAGWKLCRKWIVDPALSVAIDVIMPSGE